MLVRKSEIDFGFPYKLRPETNFEFETTSLITLGNFSMCKQLPKLRAYKVLELLAIEP